MSSTEDKSLLATAAPPPRRLKSTAAAAALLGLSFGLGAAVLVSFVIGSLAAVAIEPQSVALTPMAFSEKRQYKKCGVSCTHDLECGSCGNDCVATRAEINRSSITLVSIIRLCTTAQGQAAQRQVLHDVQAPGRRQVQALLQVLREQRGLHR